MYVDNQSLEALRVTFSLLFDQAQQQNIETIYDQIATEVDSKAAKNVYGWMLQQLVLREWKGPRVVQNLSEHAYEVPNKKYEGTIQLQRERVEDDNLDDFKSRSIPQLAVATRKHPDDLIIAALLANVLTFDGLSLFNDAHPTFAPAAFAQTYDNNFVLDLTADNFNTVWSAMASIPGEDGKPLGLVGDVLLVPPQLKRVALTIMQSTTYAVPGATTAGQAATVDNALRGWANVVVSDRLAVDPTAWYVIASNWGGLRPFVYQKRTAPEFVARDNPNDPTVFDLDMFTYGVRARDAVAPTIPFLIAKSKP